MRPMLLAPLLCLALPAAARDCRLDGVDINPDNASYYAGKSGRILCYDESGELVSEEEVRDGVIVGYQRRKGLWGDWSERTVNANGNTHGVAKEFWPDGTLKSEATYDDGNVVGVSRSFHKNGKLERLSHSEGTTLEFDDAGRLESLRCAAKSLLPEDRTPCGFAGAATTDLYRHGRVAQRVTWLRGQLQRQEALDEAGAVSQSSALEDGAEIRRSFHPDGKPASEMRVVDGYRVEEREWYMNGQLKVHVVREARDRDARVETRQWRDDGTQSSIEVAIGADRVSVTSFGQTGKAERIEDFARAGHLERRRTLAPDGSVLTDEAYYPDGSRK